MEERTIRHPAASGMALVVGQWTGEGPGAESTGTLVLRVQQPYYQATFTYLTVRNVPLYTSVSAK